jgi:hypothetical protein
LPYISILNLMYLQYGKVFIYYTNTIIIVYTIYILIYIYNNIMTVIKYLTNINRHKQ